MKDTLHCVLREIDSLSTIQSLKFHSSNQDILFSGRDSGVCTIWSLKSQRPIQKQRLHQGDKAVIKLDFTQAGDLVSQARGGEIFIWGKKDNNYDFREAIQSFNSFSHNFCKFSILQKVRLQAHKLAKENNDVTDDQEGRKSDLQQCQDQTTSPSVKSTLSNVNKCDSQVASMNQELIAIAQLDSKSVQIHDVKSGGCTHKVPQAINKSFKNPQDQDINPNILDMRLVQDGNDDSIYLYSGYEDGQVRLWDLKNLKIPLHEIQVFKQPLFSLVPTQGFEKIYTTSAEGKFCELRYNGLGQSMNIHNQKRLSESGSNCGCVRMDNRIAAFAFWNCQIRIVHVRTANILGTLKYHTKDINDLQFQSNSGLLASGSSDGSIAIWDIYQQTFQKF